MRNFKNQREMRFFLSSTFEDLQQERSEIVNLFNALQQQARSRAVKLSHIDLRWGITEEDARNGLTIGACLREIDSSHPFFVGILGDRYGWCPTDEDAIKALAEYPDTARYVNRGLSMTEIEIRHGVLDYDGHIDGIFFVKEREYFDHPNQQELIADLISDKRCRVYTYNNIETLVQLLKEYVEERLNYYFPEKELSALDRFRVVQKAFLYSLSENYVRIPANHEALDEWFFRSGDEHLCLTSGSGKSALMANWLIESILPRNDVKLIYMGVDAWEPGNPWNSKFIWLMCNELGTMPEFADIWSDASMRYNVEAYIDRIKKTGVKILIVAYDKSRGMTPNLSGLPSCKNIKILSASKIARQGDKNIRYFDIKTLDEDGRRKFIESKLSKVGKRLSENQLRQILSAPLYQEMDILDNFLRELCQCNGLVDLSDTIDSFTAYGISREDFFELQLQRAERRFSVDKIRLIFYLKLVCGNQLNESDIAAILDIRPLEWSILSSTLFTITHWSFCNPDLERAAIKRYGLESPNSDNSYHLISYIDNYLRTLTEASMATRLLFGIYNILYRLGDFRQLSSYLSNPNHLDFMIDRNRMGVRDFLIDTIKAGFTPTGYLNLDLVKPYTRNTVIFLLRIGALFAETLGEGLLVAQELLRQAELIYSQLSMQEPYILYDIKLAQLTASHAEPLEYQYGKAAELLQWSGLFGLESPEAKEVRGRLAMIEFDMKKYPEALQDFRILINSNLRTNESGFAFNAVLYTAKKAICEIALGNMNDFFISIDFIKQANRYAGRFDAMWSIYALTSRCDDSLRLRFIDTMLQYRDECSDPYTLRQIMSDKSAIESKR